MRPKIPPQAWLSPIILAAFALRLYRLGLASLWYDETVSLYLARQDLAALTRHTAGDIHPPLYYYLLHFWGQFAGWSEFSAAFLSLFFGVVLIALMYRVGKEWINARVGLVAALLVATSPFNLWYSQEVRMYTLGAVLGLASVWLFMRLMREESGFRFQVSGSRLKPDPRQELPFAGRFTLHISPTFLAYAIISALGLYTLYYFVFLLVFENLFALIHIISKTNREFRISNSASRLLPTAFRAWLASQLTILLLYLPWLLIAFRQATDPPVPPWRSFTNFFAVLSESFSALTLGQSVDPAVVWPVLVIVAIVTVWGLWSPGSRFQVSGSKFQLQPETRMNHERGFRAGTSRHLRGPVTWNLKPETWNSLPLFLLGYTLIPLLTIYALSLWKPLYHVRYVFIYSPGFYLLLALGMASFKFQVSGFRFCLGSLRFTFYALRTVSRLLPVATLALLLATSAYSAHNFWFNPQYADDDLRSAVQHIAERWRPDDAVLIDAGYTYTAFDYYYHKPIVWRGRLTDYAPGRGTLDTSKGAVVLQTGSIGGDSNLGWGSPESDFYATTAADTRAALDRVFAAHPRVWLLRLYDTVVDPKGVIRDYLAQHGRLIEDEGFTGASNMRVQGYLTTRTLLTALPSSATARPVLLGKRIEFLGFEPQVASLGPGQSLDAMLYWRARQATNVDERLYMGLYSADGERVASTSELPIGNALGTSRWSGDEVLRDPVRLVLPANLSPGDYVLRVALYNPYTNEPLESEPGPWIAEDSQIELTLVHLIR